MPICLLCLSLRQYSTHLMMNNSQCADLFDSMWLMSLSKITIYCMAYATVFDIVPYPTQNSARTWLLKRALLVNFSVWENFHFTLIYVYARFLVSHSYLRGVTTAEYMLDSLYHIHIWEVSPQLSCGDTFQIRMWCSIGNLGFDDSEKWKIYLERKKLFPWPPLMVISDLSVSPKLPNLNVLLCLAFCEGLRFRLIGLLWYIPNLCWGICVSQQTFGMSSEAIVTQSH